MLVSELQLTCIEMFSQPSGNQECCVPPCIMLLLCIRSENYTTCSLCVREALMLGVGEDFLPLEGTGR